MCIKRKCVVSHLPFLLLVFLPVSSTRALLLHPQLRLLHQRAEAIQVGFNQLVVFHVQRRDQQLHLETRRLNGSSRGRSSSRPNAQQEVRTMRVKVISLRIKPELWDINSQRGLIQCLIIKILYLITLNHDFLLGFYFLFLGGNEFLWNKHVPVWDKQQKLFL